MSSTLTIEPANRKKRNLSYELKFAMSKRFNGNSINQTYDERDVSYFLGLYDAGIEDAKIVMEMIGQFEEVTIKEEY